jgi:steroid delta-isomerase-like uncharacterized protein
MSEENKAIVRRLVEQVFNQGDLALLDELVAPTYVLHDRHLPEVTNREGFKHRVALVRTAFPDHQMRLEELEEDEDRVVARWVVRGTHRGPFLGIAPAGKRVVFRGVTVVRLAGGKVEEVWQGWDPQGLLQ